MQDEGGGTGILSDPGETAGHPSAVRREPADDRPSLRTRLRTLAEVQPHHLLVGFTVLVLLIGWHHTWPHLNRDFDHLHGWNASWHAQQARTAASVGVWRLGFVPAFEQLYDVGRNVWYITRYPPLINLTLWPVARLVPVAYQHAAYRLTGLAVTGVYLALLYFIGRRLRGPRVAAWTLFFGAISAEIFFFGAFVGFDYTGATALVAAAYFAYLGWRRKMPQPAPWPWLAMAFLTCAYLWAWNSTFAALPLLVDIVWFDPAGQRRRRWAQASVVAILPVLASIGTEIHYRFILPMLVGRPIFAFSRNLRETFAVRGNYKLLFSADFYRQLSWSSMTFVSAVGFVVVAAFLARWALELPRIRERRPWATVSWQFAFVASTLIALGAFVVAFPQSTLVHQFTFFQLGIPLALAGAWFVVKRGSAVKVAAIAGTLVVAFSTAGWLSSLNNTPLWEFMSGVGIRLATPPGAFVRVPVAADLDTPMMLYYSQRPLLFNLPPRYTSAVAAPRFDVTFYPTAVPEGSAALFIPVANGVVIDHTPGYRVGLAPVTRSFDRGAWIITGGGVTGSYGDWRMVEITWTARRRTRVPLAIEIGEYAPGGWTSLLTAKLRGNTIDTWGAQSGHDYRDGWLVHAKPDVVLVLRVYNRVTGHYVAGDAGQVDVPLPTTTPEGGA